MDVFFWAIDPRVAFWTRFEANFRLGRNQGPLFLNGLASPRVPGQLPKMWKTHFARHYGEEDRSAPFRAGVAAVVNRISQNTNKYQRLRISRSTNRTFCPKCLFVQMLFPA